MLVKKRFSKNFVLIIMILVAVGTGAVLGLVKIHNQQHDKKKLVSEARTQKSNDSLLREHNYTQYQIELTDYANSYTDKGEYAETERVLKQIINNVPRNKITSNTYRSYWYLSYTKKDDAA